jgi:dTDP-4-amino-4,6-dideoxygalactose transaminase
MKVKYLDFRKIWSAYPKAQEAMLSALSNGDMILRKDLEEFEKNFAKFTGNEYAVGVNSGTDALFLTLKALGVGPGDEVITVSHTFVATIQVIDNVGATPVLVDVDERTGLINWNEVREKINHRTKAIIPVHLAGDFTHIPDDITVPVINDACQALGAFSPIDIACYSFYPAKLLGGLGDGGAIVTNQRDIYDELLKLRNHYNIGKATMGEGAAFQQSEKYKFGYNSRLDNAVAAFLNEKLKTLEADIIARKVIATLYDDNLKDLPIKLPVVRNVYQDYIIRTSRRDKLHEYLTNKGIQTLGADQMPPHKFPGLGLDHYELPVTDKFFDESLRIPCNQFMTEEEVFYIINNLKKFYETM